MASRDWKRLAEIIVGYSTATQPGDRMLITMMEAETLPLVRAVHRRAVQAGAHVHVQFTSAVLDRDLLLHGNDEQAAWVPEPELEGMRWADVYVGLRGMRNPFELEGVPPERLGARRRATGQVSAARNASTRWVLVRVPTEALAQKAEMSLDDLLGFFFAATLRDWRTEAARYERLRDLFEPAEQVRIRGTGTDVAFSTRGRTYEIGDGRHNMPDGEIYTAPVEDSVEGEISFDFPGYYAEQRIEDIRLVFRAGEVVDATAETNEPVLAEALNTDEGARRVGEFGVGANDGIDRWLGEILYDEKIGGTVHLALGRSYEECGGHNRSALHWDLIKDLRSEGSIDLDGRRVFENGRWLVGS